MIFINRFLSVLRQLNSHFTWPTSLFPPFRFHPLLLPLILLHLLSIWLWKFKVRRETLGRFRFSFAPTSPPISATYHRLRLRTVNYFSTDELNFSCLQRIHRAISPPNASLKTHGDNAYLFRPFRNHQPYITTTPVRQVETGDEQSWVEHLLMIPNNDDNAMQCFYSLLLVTCTMILQETFGNYSKSSTTVFLFLENRLLISTVVTPSKLSYPFPDIAKIRKWWFRNNSYRIAHSTCSSVWISSPPTGDVMARAPDTDPLQ